MLFSFYYPLPQISCGLFYVDIYFCLLTFRTKRNMLKDFEGPYTTWPLAPHGSIPYGGSFRSSGTMLWYFYFLCVSETGRGAVAFLYGTRARTQAACMVRPAPCQMSYFLTPLAHLLLLLSLGLHCSEPDFSDMSETEKGRLQHPTIPWWMGDPTQTWAAHGAKHRHHPGELSCRPFAQFLCLTYTLWPFSHSQLSPPPLPPK